MTGNSPANYLPDFLMIRTAAFLAGAFLAAAFLAGAFFAAVFLAGALFATKFFADFLTGVALAAVFLAAVFLAGDLLAAFFATAFFLAFFAGDFFSAFVTVDTAPPITVLTASTTSDAVASAFSTIVFSAILGLLNFCVHSTLRIIETYRSMRASLLMTFHVVGSSVPGRDAARSPQTQSAHLRYAAGGSPRLHVAAALHPALWHSPTIMKGKSHAVI
jgi:hypothetical protein